MTTSPDGDSVSIGQRLEEISTRYKAGHPVIKAITKAAPELTTAVKAVERQMFQGR
jgi:hypothetical protein